MSKYSLGIDFGTNSVRALIVDCATGEEVGTAVVDYPSGEHGVWLREKEPLLARQHPRDYIQSMGKAVKAALGESGVGAEEILGIGVDTTGSTPMPVDESGTPLAMRTEFENDLDAFAWLWKDHTAYAEAAEITELAKKRGEPYLAKCGGAYSSEWFWSKALRFERVAPEVAKAAANWVELCDFIPAYLVGDTDPAKLKRSSCAAGHKAMFHSQWGGLPSRAFCAELSPGLARLRDGLYDRVYASDKVAGLLNAHVAREYGLTAGIPVAVGGFDAHFGAVGAGVGVGVMVKIMGTSTCDIMVAPNDGSVPDIPGVCGIAEESVLPGMLGLEAGQSAVGDLFNWWVEKMSEGESLHEKFAEEGSRQTPGESGLVALDWNNGNRSVLTDPLLSGLLVGQTLQTKPFEVYRALVEATAFGALRIIEQIEKYGVGVKEIVCCGGIAEKSPFVMQIYSDVCNRPMKLSRSSQTCALGAAIFGAVVGGVHSSVEEAQAAMCGTKPDAYLPNASHRAVYDELYSIYKSLHDAFGVSGVTEDLHSVMKRLAKTREGARS